MSYPFCGCCPYSDEGRPSWDCGRCRILNEMAEADRKHNNQLQIKEINVDLDIAKKLAEKHGIPELLSKFIAG